MQMRVAAATNALSNIVRFCRPFGYVSIIPCCNTLCGDCTYSAMSARLHQRANLRFCAYFTVAFTALLTT